MSESVEVPCAATACSTPRAIIEPEARAMLLDYDRTATHRSVAADARS